MLIVIFNIFINDRIILSGQYLSFLLTLQPIYTLSFFRVATLNI